MGRWVEGKSRMRTIHSECGLLDDPGIHPVDPANKVPYRSNVPSGGPAYAVRCLVQLTHGCVQQIVVSD
jgi:hypothetical protein